MDLELDVEGPGIDSIETRGAFCQARRKAKTRFVWMSAVTGEDDKFIHTVPYCLVGTYLQKCCTCALYSEGSCGSSM